MPNFRPTYDERLPAVSAAITAMPGNLAEVVPGLTKARLERFFRRFSVLLGRLDKSGAKHPQYLWIDGVLAPDSLPPQTDAAIANMANGAASFVQNSLPALLKINDALERAVGTDPDEAKALASSVASDLAIAVSQTDGLQEQAANGARSIRAIEEALKSNQGQISSLMEQARGDVEKASAARRAIEALTRPDARNKTSLETLAKRARDRAAEIEELANATMAQLDAAKALAAETLLQRDEAVAVLDEVQAAKNEAEKVLNLSSQAGLAASYQKESQRLQSRSGMFTGILYVSAVLTIGVAAFYVLPELSRAVSQTDGHLDFWKSFSIVLLRASVLAPLVFVIYFTNKRIGTLELLRMDYAEKAAASLAYSGYKDQVEADEALLHQLKSSLLIKFAEHPERLLRPEATTTTAKVKTPGFEAETTVGTRPPTPDEDPT